MKISELIKLHGLPVKITIHEFIEDNWFEVIADKRSGNYPGFWKTGFADKMGDNLDDWEVYVEPTKKIKLYAYLRTLHTPFKLSDGCVGIDKSFTLEFFNSETSDSAYTRAPQFDCEIPYVG